MNFNLTLTSRPWNFDFDYDDMIKIFILDDDQDPGAALDSQANYGVFGNVLVIGGFAAFAFVVRYVLQTMAALE